MSDFTAPGLSDPTDDQPGDAEQPPTPEDLPIGTEVSDLEALATELAPVTLEPCTIEVPMRPGYAIRCRTDFTGKDLDTWRGKAKDKRFSDGLDGIKAAALTLGATCIAILRNGRPVLNDGEPVTFSTPAFMGQFGTRDVDHTVRRFFGSEGHVDDAANRLLREAGYGGGEVTVSDPTS